MQGPDRAAGRRGPDGDGERRVGAPGRPARTPLTRERVLRTAVDVADGAGVGGLTIRSLAGELGVKPMALYHHVANKEAILDGVVDLVLAEIDRPDPQGDWRLELHRRSVSVLAALRRHPWALALLESRRSPGPATLRHHDAVIGLLRHAGFDYADIGHAVALVDAFVYGFALQEATLPFESPEEIHDLAEELLGAIPDGDYPNLVAFARHHVLRPGYDFADEFEVGLSLVLDAIASLPTAPGPGPSS